jgi:hypothetical protein
MALPFYFASELVWNVLCRSYDTLNVAEYLLCTEYRDIVETGNEIQ